MSQTRIFIERNGLPALAAQIGLEVARRDALAMQGARGAVRDSLAAGATLQNDTGALSESMSVASAFGSDEGARRDAARQAYENNPSRYEGIERPAFDAVAGAEAPLPPMAPGTSAASLNVLLGYGYENEIGFDNAQTGKYQHLPWFAAPVLDYLNRELAGHYVGVLRDAVTNK